MHSFFPNSTVLVALLKSGLACYLLMFASYTYDNGIAIKISLPTRCQIKHAKQIHRLRTFSNSVIFLSTLPPPLERAVFWRVQNGYVGNNCQLALEIERRDSLGALLV